MAEEKFALVLMGIKHCGKSTQGKLLARKYNVPFFDTDDVLKNREGIGARQLYLERGADGFYEAEANACLSVVQQIQPLKKYAKNGIAAVIATGGGICNNTKALELLHKNGIFIFLESDEEIAAQRIIREAKFAEDGTVSNLPAYIAKKNPLSKDEVRDIFHSFYVERCAIYNQLADVTVKMIDAPRDVNLKRIVSSLAAAF